MLEVVVNGSSKYDESLDMTLDANACLAASSCLNAKSLEITPVSAIISLGSCIPLLASFIPFNVNHSPFNVFLSTVSANVSLSNLTIKC